MKRLLLAGAFAMTLAGVSLGTGCRKASKEIIRTKTAYAAEVKKDKRDLSRYPTSQLEVIAENIGDVNELAGRFLQRFDYNSFRDLNYREIAKYLDNNQANSLQEVASDSFASFRGDALQDKLRGFDNASRVSRDEVYLRVMCVSNEAENSFKGCKYLKNVKTGDVYEIEEMRRIE